VSGSGSSSPSSESFHFSDKINSQVSEFSNSLSRGGVDEYISLKGIDMRKVGLMTAGE